MHAGMKELCQIMYIVILHFFRIIGIVYNFYLTAAFKHVSGTLTDEYDHTKTTKLHLTSFNPSCDLSGDQNNILPVKLQWTPANICNSYKSLDVLPSL